MQDADHYAVDVEVAPRFLDDQSSPDEGRYAFAYTIRIHNRGRVAARLVARHWRITDAEGRVEHVDGDGVIGEQPRLRPGEDFRYTSGVMLGTEHGTMLVRDRAAHALLTPGYQDGTVDPLGAARLLGIGTNRNLNVIQTLAAKWC